MADAAVAVVGGGPIGLTTFLGLRRAGVDAVLVEKHAATAFVPKALLLNERTMEVFRQLGLEDDIRAVSLPRDEVGFIFRAETLTAEAYDRFPMVHRSAHTAVESCLCSQDALEPVLRDHAERLAPGQVRFGTRLVGIHQDAEGVDLQLVDVASGAERTLRCRYAVAADGSRSTARELLGVEMRGEPSLGHSVHVVFDAPIGPRVADRASAMYYVGTSLFVIVDGDRRWRLMINDVPAAAGTFTEEDCTRLIREGVGVPDLEVEIKGIFPWEPSALLADRFRDGRVLLAGDAAHVRPPWGGLGMNAGIGDAHNLTWKLAEVVTGRAGEDLIDTYELERRPIAERTIRAAIANGGGGGGRVLVSSPDPADREAAARRRRAEGLVLGFTYSSPAVIADGTLPPDVEDEHADYVPTARPGHRAPHFWVDTESSITDRFGEGLVLLAGPDGSAWKAAAEELASELGAPLRAYVVGGDLSDPLDGWSERYGAGAAGAVLVRPDGIVAWRTTEAAPDPRAVLLDVVSAVLALRPVGAPTPRG